MVDLPSPGTPLLGRDHEVENVVALLRGGGVRFVTVTGPGGVGKTRLAIEVARILGSDLRDGAVFVDLAVVTEPVEVAAAIARTLGVGQSGEDEPAVALRRALAPREVVLVLDNFEHVLGAAPLPVDLVERCPDVHVLVTSRAPLRVRAERVFRLAALPVPLSATGSDVAASRQFGSVALFCERAAAIRPDFRLGDDNVAAIVGICRAVDGLPLAIELAAARVTHLNPTVIVERLETPAPNAPLDTLSRGAIDLPARQRTMRDTIAWSYHLLNPLEQRLLRRLSVFEGDCALDAIESVCADSVGEVDSDGALVGAALLDALAGLVDLHLVEPDVGSPDEARFEMLVTIREFGRERLTEAGEPAALRSRHAELYLSVVEVAAIALDSPAEREWMGRLEREIVEVRVALRHFVTTGNVADGLRLASGAGKFWLYEGQVAEGRQWLGQLLGLHTDRVVGRRDHAAALLWSARLAMHGTGSSDVANEATVLGQLEDALALARSVGDSRLELLALSFLATVVGPHDPPGRAMARATEGLTRCAQLGERWWLPELLNRAARMAQQTEDTERAAALAAEACTLADELGNERLSIESRITLAFVAHGTAHAGAAPRFATLVPRAEAFGDRGILTRLYPAAGLEALVAGRVADATRWFRIGLELARDTGYRQSVGFGVMGAQAIASIGAQWRTAARLHGALAPYRSTLRHRMPPEAWHSFEQLTAGAREAIGDDEHEAMVCAGTDLTWDAALQEAIGACEVASGSGERQARSTSHRAWNTDLTERELDVLRLIAAGGTNKDVAAALGISPKTVMHHSVAIYSKLGVRGRAEATAYAYRNDLIDAPQPQPL